MKQKILIYGCGNTFKRNIYWIKQLYTIIGMTDARIMLSDPERKEYKIEDAVRLDFDIVLVTSMFFDEIKQSLTENYHVEDSKICWFMDEFSNERHITFGDKNPNTTFYVFRAHWQEVRNGFYNFFDRVITSYYKTRKLGYELLVDMKNYYTEYAGLERYGTVNVWEDYYEQPSEYTLDDVYQSKNVILSKFDDEEYNYPKLSESKYLSNIWWVETYEILGKKFWINPNKVLQECIAKEMIHMKISGKTLGVLARGTDYLSRKPKGHPVPIDIDLFVVECQKQFIMGEYEYIYLATEDLDFLERFQNIFGKKLLFVEQMRMDHNVNKALMDIRFDRENDNYFRGLEYCTVIEILARCDSLLANCCCGGVLGAIAINAGKYKKKQVLDAGIYT